MKKTLWWLIPTILVLALLVKFAMSAISKLDDIDPPYTSDLVPTRQAISDKDNAYTYFAATNTLYWPNCGFKHNNISAFLRGQTNNDELVHKAITGNSETFASVERGLLCPYCQPPEVKRMTDVVSYIDKWRSVGKLFALKAMNERQNGHYSESAETCIKLLKYGDLIQKDAEGIIQYAVSTAILQFGLDQTRQLVQTKRLSDSEVRALAQQVDKLALPHCGLIRALKVEYICDAKMIDDILDGNDVTSGQARSDIDSFRHFIRGANLTWIYLLQSNRTKKICADFLRDTIANAPLPYARMNLYDPIERLGLTRKKHLVLANLTKPNGFGKFLCSLILTDDHGNLIRECRTKCSIAATRVFLACEAYRQAVGKLPPDLETLVPKYLDSVPLDPFDGAPIRYSKAKGIVYSVGIDLKDSGGSEKLSADDKSNPPGETRWKTEDAVFHLQMKTNPAEDDQILY